MIRTIDLFCGAGGSSWGARTAGARIIAGFDVWALALRTFKDNFPEARIYGGKLQRISTKQVASELGQIDLILASPECNGHTNARGNRRPSEDSVMTAFEVVRFARVFRPRWVVVENVINFRSWKGYPGFLMRLEELGYRIRVQKLDAAMFGVPQSRKRLFIVGDLEQTPPEIEGRKMHFVPAGSVVELNGRYPVSSLMTPRRAPATLERAQRAIRALGPGRPFLLVYYGSDRPGGWQKLGIPLRTVTTLDRFALVKWIRKQPVVRMLQPGELQAAMGFPRPFKLRHGTRRDRIRLLGNAVCPPVMAAVIRALSKS